MASGLLCEQIMLLAIASFAVLYVAGVCIMTVGLAKAPIGEQDERGFRQIRRY